MKHHEMVPSKDQAAIQQESGEQKEITPEKIAFVSSEENDEDKRHDMQQVTLTNKLNEISRMEELREELGAAETNTSETEKMSQEKTKIQEALVANTKQREPEIAPAKTDGQPEKMSDNWKGFKQEWFSDLVPDEYEYIAIAKEVMRFSEDLASRDPEYKKRLSQEVFNFEKNDNLSNFKGVDSEGRLLKRDGTATNFAYNMAGFSMKRAEYESKLVYAYAKEKGILK
jgi:hypothetical protein